MKIKLEDLMQKAKEAEQNAYAPYSNFKVGCAVLSADDKIYLGANIENASYGLSNCAERSALFNAFSNGQREIKALALWTKQGNVFPCGACRQVILELAKNADICVNYDQNNFKIYKISDILPYSFGTEDLKK
jgi:cytidine deaminase